MTEEKKTKREIVIETIRAGGATIQTLMEAVGTKAAGIASQFTYLRLMGQDDDGGLCPVKDEETGIFSMITGKEWKEVQAEKKANAGKKKAPAKSPEDRLEAAIKRQERCAKTDVSYQNKIDADDDPIRELEIRAELAALNLELADIELAAANKACPDGLPEVEEVADDNEEEGEDLA